MRRVTGIGGIFFRAKDPMALGAWYAKHLGIDVQKWGGANFNWKDDERPDRPGQTVWSPFPDDTKYFGAGGQGYMVNYRVEDVRALAAALRAEGVAVDDKIEESEYGIFAWATDPEGNRFELWQPPKGGC